MKHKGMLAPLSDGLVWVGLYANEDDRPDTLPSELKNGITACQGWGKLDEDGNAKSGTMLYCAATSEGAAKLIARCLEKLAENIGRYDWKRDRLPPDLWHVGMDIPESWFVDGSDEQAPWTLVSLDKGDGKLVFTLEKGDEVRTEVFNAP